MDVRNPSGGDDGPDCDAPAEVRAIEESLAVAINTLHLAWDQLQHALARLLEGREVGHPDLQSLQEQVGYDERHAHDVVALALRFDALTRESHEEA